MHVRFSGALNTSALQLVSASDRLRSHLAISRGVRSLNRYRINSKAPGLWRVSIMNRTNLLAQLERRLKAMASQGLGGLDRAAMERAVEAFIRDDVNRSSKADILHRFVTSRGSMEAFMCYLDRRICSPQCRGNPDLASACPPSHTHLSLR